VQYQSPLSIREVARHVCVYSIVFGLIALEAAYGSAVSSLAAHVITSKFILRMLTSMEYTIVAGGAVTVTLGLCCDVLNSLKRFIR
jgi:hypothetical protein